MQSVVTTLADPRIAALGDSRPRPLGLTTSQRPRSMRQAVAVRIQLAIVTLSSSNLLSFILNDRLK